MKPDTFQERLSQNFTYREMTASATARRKKIVNTPSIQSYLNLVALCRDILQPLRDAWGSPIIVSSGYRCYELNRAVGGVRNSDHMYGCAADIKTVEDTPEENKKLYDLIRDLTKKGVLKYVKQVIDEYGYDWIHIAYQDGRSKKINEFIHINK